MGYVLRKTPLILLSRGCTPTQALLGRILTLPLWIEKFFAVPGGGSTPPGMGADSVLFTGDRA
jgi:hypothetical protein